MNYPQEQFEVLKNSLITFRNQLDLTKINPNALHYIVYQQFSEGQKHNHLYCYNGEMKRYYQLNELEKKEAIKFLDTENKVFLLYPDGCNDNHVKTAVKKAIKELYV